MAIARILDDAVALRLGLAADGDDIAYWPIEAMTADLAARIVAAKPQLLALLRQAPLGPYSLQELAVLAHGGVEPADVPIVAQVKVGLAALGPLRVVEFEPAPMTPATLPPDWREAFEERAGIMEFDANLPREEAERLALRDILALMDGARSHRAARR